MLKKKKSLFLPMIETLITTHFTTELQKMVIPLYLFKFPVCLLVILSLLFFKFHL